MCKKRTVVVHETLDGLEGLEGLEDEESLEDDDLDEELLDEHGDDPVTEPVVELLEEPIVELDEEQHHEEPIVELLQEHVEEPVVDSLEDPVAIREAMFAEYLEKKKLELAKKYSWYKKKLSKFRKLVRAWVVLHKYHKSIIADGHMQLAFFLRENGIGCNTGGDRMSDEYRVYMAYKSKNAAANKVPAETRLNWIRERIIAYKEKCNRVKAQILPPV